MKLILTTVLLLFEIVAAQAQAISIGPFFTPHLWSTYTTPIIGGTVGVEVGYYYSTIGNQAPWVSDLNVEYISLQAGLSTMNYVKLGDQRNLFNVNGTLTAGIGMKIAESDQVKLMFTPEAGVSYSNKTFYTTNNQNMIVGSHLNAIVGARLTSILYVDDNSALTFGTELTHQSNSATSYPNDGINRINIYLGILTNMDVKADKEDYVVYNKQGLDVQLTAGYGGHEVTGYYPDKTSGFKYPDSVAVQHKSGGIPQASVSAMFNLPVNSTFSVGIGSEVIYKFRPFTQAHYFDTFSGRYTSSSSENYAANLGASIWLGKVVLSGTCGYFISSKLLDNNQHWYPSFSASYFITPALGLEIKSYPSNFASAGIRLLL